MDYDLFDEEKKETERAPTPVEEVGNFDARPILTTAEPPRKKRSWGRIVGAIGLALVIFLAGGLTCWLCLDSEIRTLLEVKKKIQQDYYYKVTDGDFYDAVFEGINEYLLDPYSAYMTADEFAAYKSSGEGNRSGIGVTFLSSEKDELKIYQVSGNSPAEEAGLCAGDKIIGGGESEDSVAVCGSYDELVSFLSGIESGVPFYLKVEGADGERTVALRKQNFVENYVFYRSNNVAYTFTGKNADTLTERGTPFSYLDEDTAYIRLTQFNGNADTQFKKAMDVFKAEGKENLVLDLRGNGGGYMWIMQSISSYFVKSATGSNPVVAIADYKNGSREEYRAYGNYYGEYFGADSKIYLLADENSASASECLIGCMIDYGAISYADICLTENDGVAKTYGKGIMQTTQIVDYFKQDAVKLTTAEITWPSGKCIHGIGVLSSEGTKTVIKNQNFNLETQAAIEEVLKK